MRHMRLPAASAPAPRVALPVCPEQARRHVNRLCLAAGVPLVESGTAGFLGQVGSAV